MIKKLIKDTVALGVFIIMLFVVSEISVGVDFYAQDKIYFYMYIILCALFGLIVGVDRLKIRKWTKKRLFLLIPIAIYTFVVAVYFFPMEMGAFPFVNILTFYLQMRLDNMALIMYLFAIYFMYGYLLAKVCFEDAKI